MTPDRHAELRDKVHHGYNLLASEAREVFAHYGEPIEPKVKRCITCKGDGWDQSGFKRLMCTDCNGSGYEVAK